MTDEILTKANLLCTQIEDIEDQREYFTDFKVAVDAGSCWLSLTCDEEEIKFDDKENKAIIHAAIMKKINQRLKTLKARFAKL